MAYSGSVGTTVIDVQTLIDHGARRCGKLAEELTSEQVLSARQSLYFFLSHLINRGIQYWCISKVVIGLKANEYIYSLPLGAVDALNVLYRTMTRPTGAYSSSAGGTAANAFDGDIETYCLQTSAAGNIAINYGVGLPYYIGSIGFMPYVAGGGSQTWNYVFESSLDGITWTTLYTGTSVTVTDKQWVWQDIDPGAYVGYYRMRAISTTTLALRELYFGTDGREIQMSRLNRDDYTNLPNKQFTANQPFQFWFDRTIPLPTMYLWPVPNDNFVQATVWYSRQIMDVGQLYGELEIPQRWYEAVLMNLSHRMSMELPNVDMARTQYLETQAARYQLEAEQEERDNSPIYWAPNISVYTR
jgi:hypothetical protein